LVDTDPQYNLSALYLSEKTLDESSGCVQREGNTGKYPVRAIKAAFILMETSFHSPIQLNRALATHHFHRTPRDEHRAIDHLPGR